jgi:glycosyltransferase involved in cell wall biosynthesis
VGASAKLSATFLLPVYNGAPTLRGAIESVLAQDDPDFELLVLDDASSDGSATLADAYRRRDSRVVVVAHERNAGLASTLNEGLERARNEFVLRMDQDDISLPSRLRVQLAYLDAHPGIAVVGSWVFHMGARPEDDRLVELPSTPHEVAVRLQRENCIYHPSVALRRSVVLGAGGYRSEFKNAEDYELWLRLAHEHDLANVREPLLRYRFSLGGMTLSRKWEQLYYVHLAQAVHQHTAIDLERADALARASLDEVNRRWFMSQVARGTVSELVALRHWHDALRLSLSFGREIGLPTSARLLALVASERRRAWTS